MKRIVSAWLVVSTLLSGAVAVTDSSYDNPSSQPPITLTYDDHLPWDSAKPINLAYDVHLPWDVAKNGSESLI